jgi:hypothetical protein
VPFLAGTFRPGQLTARLFSKPLKWLEFDGSTTIIPATSKISVQDMGVSVGLFIKS